MKQIQEFSDEELAEELMARYDDIIISARRILTINISPDAQRQIWWKGDLDACVGMAHGIIHDLIVKTYGISQNDIRDID